ncbi:MAG: LysR substrate-binding domain-containing protein [Pseudomonadota bacterium]
MKLQQLRFLAAVVQSDLNITTAAERLFTSQPGISKQIRLLEDELGLTLFVRRGKRLESLTPEGEQVVARAERVLGEVDRIKALSEELRGDLTGQLSLATTQTQARYLLPPVLARFNGLFKDTTVELHQGTSEQIRRMLNERQVDLAMASSSEAQADHMVQLPVYRWDRVVIVPRDHPLTRLDERLTLESLARYPLVTYLFSDRPESSLMSAFRQRRLEPTVAFTARDSDIIKTCVRNQLGVGIVAAMAIDQRQDRDLITLPVDHLLPTLTTWIGWRKDQLLKTYHTQFLHLLAPHLDPALIDDAVRGRAIPALSTLSEESDLPIQNTPEPMSGLAA